MENSVEALYIGAAVLIFMIALSFTLSSFSSFRTDLESLILSKEKVDQATTQNADGTKSFINYLSGEDERRTVGIETVLNSLERVFKENNTVIIKLNYAKHYAYYNEIIKNFKDKNLIVNASTQYYTDPSNNTYPIINQNDKLIVFKLSVAQNNTKFVYEIMNEEVYSGKTFYQLIKGATFTEYVGTYYQEDVGVDDTTKISDANKREARVLTYIEK